MTAADDDRFAAALEVRREVMGPEYVERALADESAENTAFQRLVTETAWGQWLDPRLSRRERSLVTLAITAALGRMEEFELHARGALRNGVSETELAALVAHIGGYAGIPAAIAARRATRAAVQFMTENS